METVVISRIIILIIILGLLAGFFYFGIRGLYFLIRDAIAGVRRLFSYGVKGVKAVFKLSGAGQSADRNAGENETLSRRNEIPADGSYGSGIDPTGFLGKNIVELITDLRAGEVDRGEDMKQPDGLALFKYNMMRGSESLDFPDSGFSLHSRDRSGKISGCFIYFEGRDVGENYYSPAENLTRGEFGNLSTMRDFEEKLGPALGEAGDVKTGDVKTGDRSNLPGKVFDHDGKKVTAYSEDGNTVAYIHIGTA